MKKIRLMIIVVTLLVLTVFVYGMSSVQAEKTPVDYVHKTVKLTDQQKSELAALHKDILDRKKALISKYVEFGVISEEKGKKIVDRMEEHYAKLESNGYIPNWDRKKNMHKH